MKIAHIGSRGYPGFAGGVEKCLEEVCPRLVSLGHEVTVYGSRGMTTDQKFVKGVRLRRMRAIPTKHLETFSRTFLAALDALVRRYDIVHFHALGPSLFSWITRWGGLKTVVTVHGLDWQRDKWGSVAKRLLRTGEMTAIRFPHRTIVVSQPLKRFYEETYGRPVLYIPNGFSPYPAIPPDLILKKFGLQRHSYILFVSRLVPEKECHTLIRAYKELEKNKPRLVIAGASWHSDRYVEELKAMGAPDPGILFLGWADGQLLKELFSNALLYCLPSKIEGLSLSLLEAMGCGICPVVSDIPENREVIGEAGVSFRTGDWQDLAAQLGHLIASEEERKKKGDMAGNLVRDRYNWDKVVLELQTCYEDMISGNNK